MKKLCVPERTIPYYTAYYAYRYGTVAPHRTFRTSYFVTMASTHSIFSFNPVSGPFTLLLSQDRIVYEAYLKSPGAFTLKNRLPGVRTNIQSLSLADVTDSASR